jgi:hypothetical protein
MPDRALRGADWWDNLDMLSAEEKSTAEAALSSAMKEIYRRAKVEVAYNATYFLRMLSEDGALATARRLVMSSTPSEGFTALWERGRMDLTVEAQILSPEVAVLFTDDELDTARRRLVDYGYRPK